MKDRTGQNLPGKPMSCNADEDDWWVIRSLMPTHRPASIPLFLDE
jgi:hypothetical protein